MGWLYSGNYLPLPSDYDNPDDYRRDCEKYRACEEERLREKEASFELSPERRAELEQAELAYHTQQNIRRDIARDFARDRLLKESNEKALQSVMQVRGNSLETMVKAKAEKIEGIYERIRQRYIEEIRVLQQENEDVHAAASDLVNVRQKIDFIHDENQQKLAAEEVAMTFA